MFDALNEPYLKQQADTEPLVSNEQVRIHESRIIWAALHFAYHIMNILFRLRRFSKLRLMSEYCALTAGSSCPSLTV